MLLSGVIKTAATAVSGATHVAGSVVTGTTDVAATVVKGTTQAATTVVTGAVDVAANIITGGKAGASSGGASGADTGSTGSPAAAGDTQTGSGAAGTTSDSKSCDAPPPSLLLPVKSRLGTTPVDPKDNASHAVLYRYTVPGENGKVDVTKAILREDSLDFFYPHMLEEAGAKKSQLSLDFLNMRRDVFLLAFQAIQALPHDDRWSFYQIAAIHGLPHITYDGDEGNYDPSNPDWWGGYCQHGTPLFPTWHRPYMLLIEQSIIRQAKLFASTLSDASEKAAVLALADDLRFPYWDMASQSTQTQGIPDIFTSTDAKLLYSWKSFSYTSIPNPLKSFVLPVELGTPFLSSDVYNPTARPNYVIPASGTPFTPQYYPTVRYPNSAYVTQTDTLNLNVVKTSSTTLVEGVHAVFQHSKWLPFSNHYWSEETHGDGSVYGHYTSIELVHDQVHTLIGGPGGQMAYTEIAGFEPMFWFHHCNVDRLTALWQYCYPDEWIPEEKLQLNHDGTYTEKPGSEANAETLLTPFRLENEGAKFVNSNDVRLVDADCGYSYPELLAARKLGLTASQMLKYMFQMYQPPQAFLHRWVLMVERIVKRAFNGPFNIRIFIGKPDANASTSTSIPNYAGSISIFARAQGVKCANCDTKKYMRGSLDLSKTMVRLGITTAAILNKPDEGDAEIPANPLCVDGAITIVFVDLLGNQLDPTSVAGWEGPIVSLYYQVGNPVEEVNEYLIETLLPKIVHKFSLTSDQAKVAAK